MKLAQNHNNRSRMTAMALAAALAFAGAQAAHATDGIDTGESTGSPSSKGAVERAEDRFDSGDNPGHRPQQSTSGFSDAFERASDVISVKSEEYLRSVGVTLTVVTPETLLLNAVAADADAIAAQISHAMDYRMAAIGDNRAGKVDKRAAVNKLSRMARQEAEAALNNWARNYVARIGAVNAGMASQISTLAQRYVRELADSLSAAVKSGLEVEFDAAPEDNLQ